LSPAPLPTSKSEINRRKHEHQAITCNDAYEQIGQQSPAPTDAYDQM